MPVEFCTGFIAAWLIIGGLFFLHAWRQSQDRLFLFFAIAFWIMALERVIWGIAGQPWSIDRKESLRTLVYSIRFTGFCLIALAVMDKNRYFVRQKKPPIQPVRQEPQQANEQQAG